MSRSREKSRDEQEQGGAGAEGYKDQGWGAGALRTQLCSWLRAGGPACRRLCLPCSAGEPQVESCVRMALVALCRTSATFHQIVSAVSLGMFHTEHTSCQLNQGVLLITLERLKCDAMGI